MESSAIRTIRGTLRTIFTSGPKDETSNFVKFQDEPAYDTTEMAKIANGSVGESGGYGTECVREDEPDKYWEKENGFLGVQEDGVEKDVRASRNRISEWQAGWNVTNAIQVITSFHSL